MTFALKTENGVSSCGGLLVSPIIGRFCGYLTSGRSPFSNGSTAVAARARKEGAVIPAPSAAMAAPECFMRLRRSIIAFLPFHLGRGRPDASTFPAVGSSRLPKASRGIGNRYLRPGRSSGHSEYLTSRNSRKPNVPPPVPPSIGRHLRPGRGPATADTLVVKFSQA